MTIVKQHVGYLVRVQIAGRDVRRTAPTRDLAKALDAHLKAQRFSTRNGLAQDQPRMLFADFYAEWWTRFEHGSAGAKKPRARTLESVADIRKRLKPLDNLWCDGITRERLEQLAAGIASEGHQDRAHKALHLARRVLKDAAERGVRVDERVFKARIAPPKPRELQPLSWGQVMAVYSWLPEHVCRAAPFLALTGLRVSEFCALTDADVFLGGRTNGPSSTAEVDSDRAPHQEGHDERRGAAAVRRRGERAALVASPSVPLAAVELAGRHSDRRDSEVASYIVVRASKTDAGVRRVYLCDEAARLVREQMLARPNMRAGNVPAKEAPLARGSHSPSRESLARSVLLFPNEDGNPYNRRSFHAVLARASKHAQLTGVHPHALRATCVTLSAQAGVPFEVVKEQLGWSDATAARMYVLYRRLAAWETPKAVRLLDAVVEEQEQKSLVATAARCPVKSEEA